MTPHATNFLNICVYDPCFMFHMFFGFFDQQECWPVAFLIINTWAVLDRLFETDRLFIMPWKSKAGHSFAPPSVVTHYVIYSVA